MTPVIWFTTQKKQIYEDVFAGTRKCPHNLNRPHFAGVYSYECPHKCAAVSAHTHTHTHTQLLRENAVAGIWTVPGSY